MNIQYLWWILNNINVLQMKETPQNRFILFIFHVHEFWRLEKTQNLQLMPLLGLFGTQYNIYNIIKDKSIQIFYYNHDLDMTKCTKILALFTCTYIFQLIYLPLNGVNPRSFILFYQMSFDSFDPSVLAKKVNW